MCCGCRAGSGRAAPSLTHLRDIPPRRRRLHPRQKRHHRLRRHGQLHRLPRRLALQHRPPGQQRPALLPRRLPAPDDVEPPSSQARTGAWGVAEHAVQLHREVPIATDGERPARRVAERRERREPHRAVESAAASADEVAAHGDEGHCQTADDHEYGQALDSAEHLRALLAVGSWPHLRGPQCPVPTEEWPATRSCASAKRRSASACSRASWSSPAASSAARASAASCWAAATSISDGSRTLSARTETPSRATDKKPPETTASRACAPPVPDWAPRTDTTEGSRIDRIGWCPGSTPGSPSVVRAMTISAVPCHTLRSAATRETFSRRAPACCAPLIPPPAPWPSSPGPPGRRT